MKKHLLLFLSLLVLSGILSSAPAASFVGDETGPRRFGGTELETGRARYAEALIAQEREREYRSEKQQYLQTLERMCAAEKRYDLSLLECVLFVPLFGLVLPFFAVMFFGTVRSMWMAYAITAIKQKGGNRNTP